MYVGLVAYLYLLYEGTRIRYPFLSFKVPLHTFSDRGVWGVHRQLAGLVLLDPVVYRAV